MAVSVSILLIILIPLIFGIPILIGIYVYRDANKRGMNAVLWTLIAILTPSLLGFIIYLLVRNNHSDLTCPSCNSPVEESYVVCPNCRTKLRPSCEACGTMVQTGWKVCPHCGTELPAYDYTVATPIRKKDNTLGKILIAILVIPIVLLVLLFVLAIPLSFSNVSGGATFSTSSVTTMTTGEFLEGLDEKEAALYQEYFNEFSSNTEQPCHLLIYDANRADDIYEYQYLIYIQDAGNPQALSYHIEERGFLNSKKHMTFDISCIPAEAEQTISVYHYEGTEELPYEYLINYNGIEYEIQPDGHVNTPFLHEKSEYPQATY